MRVAAAKDVPSYIAAAPPQSRAHLKQLRKLVRAAAPKAEERIGYGMPGYRLHGVLVYFAGYERHVGFYPGGSILRSFAKELAGYKTGKGSVQFPLDQKLPATLITKIVKMRARENASGQ